AQYRLGELYANGKVLLWTTNTPMLGKSVAASQGHRQARASLQTTKGHLSPTEFEEAEKLSEQFIQRYGPKPGSATNDHP
ncbi:MAG: hypothetical protein ACREXR_19605, partial [Gammaproteobacteria bacterium]